jgi:hypothetical protein
LRKLLFVLVLLLTGLYAAYMVRLYLQQREIQQMLVGMRRLAALVIQDYPDRQPPTQEGNRDFWRHLGRKGPITDAWGLPFVLERREQAGGGAIFVWRSAGPDQLWDTADDLEVVVPYADKPKGQPDFDAAPPSAGNSEGLSPAAR